MVESEFQTAIQARRSERSFDGAAIPLEVLQRLLFAGQGITDESGKRTVPSAHALHPLRLMVIVGNVEGLQSGLYGADQNSLELTLVGEGDMRPALETAALEDQPWISKASAIIAICADFDSATQAFADQPPEGKRGARYVYIEAGAAAQNVQLQAVTEGLGSVLVAGIDDEATSQVLKLAFPLEAVLLLCVGSVKGET